jgi:hypothetical protein
VGGTQNRSGRGVEVKNSHALPEREPPIIQRYTTELNYMEKNLPLLYGDGCLYIQIHAEYGGVRSTIMCAWQE